MNALENFVLGLTAVTLLTVTGGVLVLVQVFPHGLRSGVPDVAIQSDTRVLKWLSSRPPCGVGRCRAYR